MSEADARLRMTGCPRCNGDINQLSQMFQNLISNAIKFRAEHPPKIHISSVQVGESWVMSVSDNGIGIDPQYSERIFGMFKRLHGRASIRGLESDSRYAARLWNGIWGRFGFESEPGNGSTFSFTLPVVED